MNPLPGMEPTETRRPAVPPPAAPPASLAGATGPGEPGTAHGDDPPDPLGDDPPGDDAADTEPSSVVSGDEQPAESVVLIEPLPRSVVSGRAMDAARAAARRTWNFARGTAALVRRYKLETIAVLLLGVGGAVYPPVWVLGALLALPSRTWDLRDKWTGLVAPVLLVIASTVVIVVVGGRHNSIGSYAFEAWVGAGRVSRAAAVLGAGYLAWRLRHGRRQPKVPPWNVPHRLG